MHTSRITLTGADERTDIAELVELMTRFPAVEIGLLFTLTPEERPRYPSRAWLVMAASALARTGDVALHVCGGGARRELLEGRLGDLTRHAARVQLNGHLKVAEAEAAAARVGTLITQHHAANAALLGVRARNHALLVDGSGGHGLSPQAWVAPDTDKCVGFAGGLGPANLASELARIAPVARDGAWIDMEGKLRVDDWFNVPLAEQCAAIVQDSQ